MVEKNPLTPYGREVKHRLIDIDKTPGWLVHQVKEQGHRKFDSSFLAKILNGKVQQSGYTKTINEILEKEEARQNAANKLG